MPKCTHCNEIINLQHGDELLIEFMDNLFICPKCGFPTTKYQGVIKNEV